MTWRAAIVTASDGVASGARDDESGDAVADLLRATGFQVVGRHATPDDRPVIAARLRALADEGDADLVVVTGGTGFGPRDVTPEATRDVLEREAPGLAEAMRAVGRRSTPMADLSRAVAGVRAATLILDVPGSPRGATESLRAVLDVLPHALQLLAGDTGHHPPGHGQDGRPVTAEPGGAGVHGHGREHGHGHGHDEACALAHGQGTVERDWTLAAVSASPVAAYLLHWGRELGYRTVLVEPEPGRISPEHRRHSDRIVATLDDVAVDDQTDVVATDHDVDDLADHLAAALRSPARWIGLMGSPRHEPPHVAPLRSRGFDDDDIARVHRPIGLNIGSKTPPEIALATLAGLVADRQGRPGGFY